MPYWITRCETRRVWNGRVREMEDIYTSITKIMGPYSEDEWSVARRDLDEVWARYGMGVTDTSTFTRTNLYELLSDENIAHELAKLRESLSRD